MTRTTMRLAATLVGAVGLGAGCDDKASNATTTSGAPAAPASAAPSASASAEPSTTAASAATASAAPSASADAVVPAASGSAAAKTFDCGAKGQKPCPMQAWMKTVMANASSSGEGDKLAKALTYVAAHVPPGYSDWTAMAERGASRAKAGDIDGAKASCKQCHDAYKEKYKTTLRDRPF
jgi:hypothetical protein